MHTSRIEKNHAPGILKVLGAFVLDIGLLGLFWFAGMVLTTAIWTMNEYVSNGGTIPNSQPGPLATSLIGISSLYISILALWGLRGRDLHLKPWGQSVKASVVLAIFCGLCVYLLTISSTYALSYFGVEMLPANQALLEEIGKNAPMVVGLFTIVVAPVFEELFFRKQVYARFARAGFVISAYWVSSVMFALMHEPLPTQGIAKWAVMLMLYAGMGAAFAWVYQKTGRLWPAILAHASNNLFAVATLFLA